MNVKTMTKTELYELAKKHNLPNRSKMTKDELIKALSKYNKTVAPKVAPQASSSTVTSHMPENPAPNPEPARKPEYPIPDRYNLDTVVLLPVNPKKEYVYWEVIRQDRRRIPLKIQYSAPGFHPEDFSV